MLTLVLAVSLNAQEQPKKTIKEAIEVAKLNKEEAAKVKAIQKERWKAQKVIKEKGLDKKENWKEMKAVRDDIEAKIIAAIGEEKGKVYNEYWRWKKKEKN